MLGLIAILNAGHDLQAPTAVGGSWQIRGDFRPLVSAPCTAVLGRIEKPVLTILQSGPHLAVALDQLQGAGRIEHAALTADELRLSNDAACVTRDGSGYLHASVEGTAGQEVLKGVVGVNGCPDCAEVSFRATRRPPAQKGR